MFVWTWNFELVIRAESFCNESLNTCWGEGLDHCPKILNTSEITMLCNWDLKYYPETWSSFEEYLPQVLPTCDAPIPWYHDKFDNNYINFRNAEIFKKYFIIKGRKFYERKFLKKPFGIFYFSTWSLQNKNNYSTLKMLNSPWY